MNVQGKRSNLEVLTAARELLSDPKNWYKGGYSGLNVYGEPCYCGAGAICKVLGVDMNDGWEVFNTPALNLLESANGLNHYPSFNDDPFTTHSEMLETFDKAIKAAKEMEITV